ncbi:DUF998 domain-containing protein [Caulobacter mirabilis]|uniref:DUF998 domain-containing protein n=1 Tax=Caulobacter mirabilis TaxID=69666 RepID=UPI001C0F107D|nr:DUF998 domain-containing protein [Caulobacter mirabilis]
MIKTVAFWAGAAGVALLVAVIVVAGAAWPGYSHVDNFISELGATGSPHGRLVNFGGFLPVGLCLTLFSIAAALVEPRSRRRTVGFACLGLFGLGYVAIAFFPCEFGCPATSSDISQVMHNLTSLAGYLGAPVGMILLGLAARRWPGSGLLFPLGLACGLVSTAAFAWMLSEPPASGLVQRVVEGSIVLWVLVCAFSLRRARTI